MAKIDKEDKCSKIISTTGATTIVQLPLAFVRSGYVNVSDSKVHGISYSGYGRSRTASSSTSAYYLGMNPTFVDPSYDNPRWYGFPPPLPLPR